MIPRGRRSKKRISVNFALLCLSDIMIKILKESQFTVESGSPGEHLLSLNIWAAAITSGWRRQSRIFTLHSYLFRCLLGSSTWIQNRKRYTFAANYGSLRCIFASLRGTCCKSQDPGSWTCQNVRWWWLTVHLAVYYPGLLQRDKSKGADMLWVMNCKIFLQAPEFSERICGWIGNPPPLSRWPKHFKNQIKVDAYYPPTHAENRYTSGINSVR